jgi:hypothetical protein
VSGQRHAPATLPPEKTRYPLYRRLVGPTQCAECTRLPISTQHGQIFVDVLFRNSLILFFSPSSLQRTRRSVEMASNIFKINVIGGELTCYNVCRITARLMFGSVLLCDRQYLQEYPTSA